MWILQNAYKLTIRQRKLVSGLVIAFILTNVQVSAAHAEHRMFLMGQNTERAAEETQIQGIFTEQLSQAKEKKPPIIRTIRTTVTAYSSEPRQTDASPFVTAAGSCVRDGVIAANFLRIGTRVRLPHLFGEKIFVVEDRMHARYVARVDVWMADAGLARQFGLKRNMVLEVVGEGDGKKMWEEGWTNQECAELNA